MVHIKLIERQHWCVSHFYETKAITRFEKVRRTEMGGKADKKHNL